MAECDRVQLGECLATIGAAAEDQKLIADQLPAAVGEDGRSMGQARTVLLVAPGGEPTDAASVRGPGAADCWVASARGGNSGFGSREIDPQRAPARSGV